MGGFATSTQTAKQKEAGNSNAVTSPWGPQSNYLQDIFKKADQTYSKVDSNHYDGNIVASFDPEQIKSFNSMINYAKTSPIPGQLGSAGTSLLGQGIPASAAGIQGLYDFRPSGSAAGTIADASLYADNPFISGQVDAATRDASRNVYEGQIPAAQRNAALTGNTNSNKEAIKEAIAQRGLSDLRGDVSANLRGQAYNHGLDLSQNQSQFADQAMLDRARALQAAGLDASQLGLTGLTGSLGAQTALFGLQNEGASGLTAAKQAELDNALAKYQMSQSDPWTALTNWYNIVGDKSWGGNVNTKTASTASTKSSSTASPASAIGGILTGIGSLIPGR